MRAAAYIKKKGPFFLQLMRWDKPIGSFLLLWPTLTALVIAAHGLPPFRLLVIFTIGVFVMRSAGCVMNDITDRNIDGHVARTQQRPLATHQLSVVEALLFLLLLLCVALLLVLLLNPLCFRLAWVAVGLAVIYPFMKRVMPYPQFVLGLAFNWGVVMAFAAIQNQLPSMAWLLYAIAILWTVAYDTIYAMVDREDDIRIGIQSTAVTWGSNEVTVVAALYLGVVLLLWWLGRLLSAGLHFDVMVVACAMQFGWQIRQIKSREPLMCLKAFRSNGVVWALVLLAVAVSFLQ